MEFDFFLLGSMEQSSHMTWTAEEFMSSLLVSFGMVDVPLKKSSLADHTIFLMFLYSRIH
jgi:hypothetical protein